MFDNEGISYKIVIPFFASKEVIDWFQGMEKQGRLSEELVSLVNAKVKSENLWEGMSVQAHKGKERKIDISSPQEQCKCDQKGDFIEGLYNWQDATTALFNQEPKIEKERKKMLQV